MSSAFLVPFSPSLQFRFFFFSFSLSSQLSASRDFRLYSIMQTQIIATLFAQLRSFPFTPLLARSPWYFLESVSPPVLCSVTVSFCTSLFFTLFGPLFFASRPSALLFRLLFLSFLALAIMLRNSCRDALVSPSPFFYHFFFLLSFVFLFFFVLLLLASFLDILLRFSNRSD